MHLRCGAHAKRQAFHLKPELAQCQVQYAWQLMMRAVMASQADADYLDCHCERYQVEKANSI